MKVAFNKVIITPNNYIGIPLAGFTPIRKCTNKLDDIYARAALLEDQLISGHNNYVLFISLDLLKIAFCLSKYITRKICEECDLSPSQIIIHATHTHKAPDITGEFGNAGGFHQVIRGIICPKDKHDRYIIWITKRIIKMVKDLFSNLKPCKIGWIQKNLDLPNIVINRRDPSRLIRPNLGIIAFRTLDNNQLLGFFINFACHGTSLADLTTELSADWMGYAVNFVERKTNYKVNVILFNGPSGDLNPITAKKLKSGYIDARGNYKSTKRIGQIVGRFALNFAQSIPIENFFPNTRFRVYFKIFWVPMMDFNYLNKFWILNKLIFWIKRYILIRIVISHKKPNFPSLDLKICNNRYGIYTTLSWIRLIAYSEDCKNSRELSILTAPGELFEKQGKRLQKICPTNFNDVFIFQITNDWIGYLFSKEDYIGKLGYEIIPSFSPIAGYIYIEEMKKLFNAMGTATTDSRRTFYQGFSLGE